MARAYAGIIAPLVVMAVLLVQGMTTPGYDPVRQTISELGTGWSGTRIVAIYGFFVLTCVWEPMTKALETKLSTVVLVASMVVIGVGCFGLDQVAAESGAWDSMTWRGRLHLILAFGFVFAAIPVACLAASRALPAAWRGLRVFSAATGATCLAVLAGTLFALAAKPPEASVVARLGLIERGYIFGFLIWQVIVSARLVRASRKAVP